jgi:hypothetical protein
MVIVISIPNFTAQLEFVVFVIVKSQSYITSDGQSASLSWCQAPIWDPATNFFFFFLQLFLYSYEFVDVGRSLWREVEPVAFFCV